MQKLCTIISIIVGLVVLIANFFQWWSITYNGKMVMKLWVKLLVCVCIAALLVCLILVVVDRS